MPDERLLPLDIPDVDTTMKLLEPTTLDPLDGYVDPNEGARLNFSTIKIVTAPTGGSLDVDPNTGSFQFTPTYLATLRQGEDPPNILPVSFVFTVTDTLGVVSRNITVTFTGGIKP